MKTEHTTPREGAKKIYVLLVGINDYPSPIPKLNGCRKDVEQVARYLKSKFGTSRTTPAKKDIPAQPEGEAALQETVDGRLHLVTLIDKAATYQNIIRGFREHLSRAKEQDTVWFHFSGHGTEHFAAKEFMALDPSGRDQTLICYKEKFERQDLLLADKELAVLLHEVSQNNPHVVVSLDSCHSGSGTRSISDAANIKPRAFDLLSMSDQNADRRPINSYYGYSTMGGNIHIPESTHVLMTACESIQTAGDSALGGVFTNNLIGTLDGVAGPIHYADLFTKTRAKAVKVRRAQTPKFAALSGFDPYTSFLEGSPMEEITEHYELFQEGETWFVRAGAINGLPPGAKEDEIKISVISETEKDSAGNPQKLDGFVTKVGAQHSQIKFTGDEMPTPDAGGTYTSYYVQVKSIPANPIYVKLEAEPDPNALGAPPTKEALEALKKLKEQWNASKNILIAKPDEDAEAPAILVEATTEGAFTLRNAQSGEKLTEVPLAVGSLNERIEKTKEYLEKIARWKRFIALDNPTTKIRGLFDFDLMVTTLNNEKPQEEPYRGKEINIYGSEKNLSIESDGRWLGINWRITVNEDKQDLFFYAFYVGPYCEIEFTSNEEERYRSGKMQSKEMLLLDEKYAFGLGPEEKIASGWFKVLATTEPLDPWMLEQSGFEGDRATKKKFNPGKISEDWCAETVKLTLVYQQNAVPNDGENPAELADGRIRIKGHSGVSAKINLSAGNADERSLDPANRLAAFEQLGYTMADFASSRDLVRQNVLELTELTVTDPVALEENPLEIVLAQKLADEEFLLPIAFDGQNYRVIGDAVAEGDETVVRIRELPAVEAEQGERSLFGALKMAFFKLAFDKTDQNQLRWADYQNDGPMVQRNEGIASRVAAAKKILLVLHGIIGDTEEMTADLAFIKDSAGKKSMKDHYDLVLTYDYENLNTPIEQTAAKLKTALEAVGIKAGDRKKVTILAHSMGGLVSRCFIEFKEYGGNKIINHLILAGTPNRGSIFGKVEGARKFAVTALNLSINFFPNFIPFSGYILKGLRTAADVLVTLGQMDPESGFLKKLNACPDPRIPYTIFAGDVKKFMENKRGEGKGMDKLLKGVGNLVNQGDENDIAATVDSIHNMVTIENSTDKISVWENRKSKPVTLEVPCHHLNYFSSEEGRAALGSMLKAAH